MDAGLNFDEGWDYLATHGLAGLPTAYTLYWWLCAQGQADTDHTASFAGGTLTQIGSIVITSGSLTSSSRIIDLGSGDFSAQTSGVVKSVVVTTKAPTATSPLLLAIADVNAGTALDLSVEQGLYVDDLAIFVGALTSGAVA